MHETLPVTMSNSSAVFVLDHVADVDICGPMSHLLQKKLENPQYLMVLCCSSSSRDRGDIMDALKSQQDPPRWKSCPANKNMIRDS